MWNSRRPSTIRRTSSSSCPADALLAFYGETIDDLKARGGYTTADVIDVTPQAPGLDAMLTRFNSEHWPQRPLVTPARLDREPQPIARGDDTEVPAGTEHPATRIEAVAGIGQLRACEGERSSCHGDVSAIIPSRDDDLTTGTRRSTRRQQTDDVIATGGGERAIERRDATAVATCEAKEIAVCDLLPRCSGANLRQDRRRQRIRPPNVSSIRGSQHE
jgi:hypothetical protein